MKSIPERALAFGGFPSTPIFFLIIDLIISPFTNRAFLLILMKPLEIAALKTSHPMQAVLRIASQGAVPVGCDHSTTVMLEMKIQHGLQTAHIIACVFNHY